MLLSGNKSMQKCLLLAEGYERSPREYGFQERQRRRAGPLQGASWYCCQYGMAELSLPGILQPTVTILKAFSNWSLLNSSAPVDYPLFVHSAPRAPHGIGTKNNHADPDENERDHVVPVKRFLVDEDPEDEGDGRCQILQDANGR